MFLKSARIENFKCIEDSGPFSLKTVICFVGKNEAGKSAILQALYKLNPVVTENGNFDLLMDYPRRKLSEYKTRHETKPDNVLTTEWELDQEDIEELTPKLGPDVLKSRKITISKGYDNTQYWTLDLDEQKIVGHYLKNAVLETREHTSLKKSKNIATLMEALKTKEELSENHKALLNTLQENFPDGNPVKEAINILGNNLPTFLYFADFDKMMGKVSLTELAKLEKENLLKMPHRIFLSLLNLVRTSSKDLNSMGKYEELTAELEAVSNRLSQTIFEYWSQNRYLEVVFQFVHARPKDPPPFNTGWVFHTRIKNTRHGVTVSFDDRSTGFVWFFSFLIWFSQMKSNYGENLLILLDDPGLSLHARAQADLLRYIKEKLSPKYQVLYTTHSPFMIDPDRLLDVRTVEDVVTKKGKILGTKIGDEVLATDVDTLFPLQAALGYYACQTLFIGKHNLLVEGPSDLLYLKWFSRELKANGKESLDSRWVIVPCGGISKISSFISLFSGKNLNIAAITDFHSGLKKKVRNLKEISILKSGHIFSAEMYVSGNEADIEDLLGRHLYITLVNECYSLEESQRIPYRQPTNTPERVVLEVENHFKSLTIDYDHFSPAIYLTENTSEMRNKLPKLNEAMNRFEKLFKDLNSLLPKVN